MINEKLKQNLVKKDEKGLEVILIRACTENNLELVEYLLFSEELTTHPDIACRNYQALRDGANQGSYEVIEYLLTSPKINREKELITARKQVLIRNACHSGNLKLVKFLLETPGIKEYINFSINKYKPFEEAIYSFNKELVFYLDDKYFDEVKEKYTYLTLFFQRIYKEGFLDFAKQLLEKKEMEHYFVCAEKSTTLAQLIVKNDKEGVEFLMTYPKIKNQMIDLTEYGSVMVAMSKANVEILNIIIVENEIPLTKTLMEFLDNKFYDTLNMRTMFENRDLNKRLSANLVSHGNEKKIKVKI